MRVVVSVVVMNAGMDGMDCHSQNIGYQLS